MQYFHLILMPKYARGRFFFLILQIQVATKVLKLILVSSSPSEAVTRVFLWQNIFLKIFAKFTGKQLPGGSRTVSQCTFSRRTFPQRIVPRRHLFPRRTVPRRIVSRRTVLRADIFPAYISPNHVYHLRNTKSGLYEVSTK